MDNMTILSLIFLGISLVAYILFGGADYGMGLVELFYPKNKEEAKQLTKQAIGPVWEANHVWLIVVIVILFIGFPSIFSALFTVLHVPLFLLLLGIVIRGAAFSFRHYDPIQDHSHTFHSLFFNISSIITPLLLGMIFASLLSPFPEEGTFFMLYIAPWVTPFAILTGLLFTNVCVLNALAFCNFEATNKPMKRWIRRVFLMAWWTTASFALLTAYAGMSNGTLFQLAAHHTGMIWAMGGITFFALFYAVKHNKKAMTYVSSGMFTTSLFVGAVLSRFPIAIEFDLTYLSWLEHSAPHISLVILNVALILGLLIVIPFLGYLFFLFKK